MLFCFVFGQEPWLLPPALDMIATLQEQGHQVKIIYAEYQGTRPNEKDYDSSLTFQFVSKKSGWQRLLTFRSLTSSIKAFLQSSRPDVIIACDVLSLQALVGAGNLRGIKKGYWGFEIVTKPDAFKASFDFYRSSVFPIWVKKMDFYLAPSASRIDKIKERVQSNIPNTVIYNCRRLLPLNDVLCETNFLSKSEYKLIYTGAVSKSQYIEDIVFAMELLNDTITLSIAGPVNAEYATHLTTIINNNPKLKGRITIHGRLSRDDAYALVNTGDIGFVFYNENDGKEARDPAPNKLSDYIAGNLWVLGGSQAYMRYWLDEKEAGLTISSITSESIANGIKIILSEQRFNDKTKLSALYKNELNMFVQAQKLVALIKSI